MRKMTEYVEMAATEYLQETGNEILDARWLAEFFQDGGVMDDHPGQDLIGFYALVQKMLTLKIGQAEKLARLQQEITSRSVKR
jgi:hypothetical protein